MELPVVLAVFLAHIHYQMLKHLPPNAVNTLLKTLNNIWFAGNFPPSWRTSTVIPITKPAKDASDPNNYRPIALTSNNNNNKTTIYKAQ